MKALRTLLFLGLIFVTSTTLAPAQTPDDVDSDAAASSAVETYLIDAVHSSVLFRIMHMDLAYFYGWFEDYSGSLTLDRENPANSSIEFEIQTASIATRNGKRDEHLRSADFFDAETYPTITFKSTEVTAVGEKEFKVTGDLTLRGKTQSIEFAIKKTGEISGGRMGARLGGLAEFTIQRTDYGMDLMVGPLGEDVDVIVSVEAIRQDADQ